MNKEEMMLLIDTQILDFNVPLNASPSKFSIEYKTAIKIAMISRFWNLIENFEWCS